MSPILGIWASAKSPAIYANSYESIATQTVGAGGAASVTFSSIPSTYKHLQIRASVKMASGGDVSCYLNSDTNVNNYRRHYVYGDGSTAAAGYQTTLGIVPGYVGSGSGFGTFIQDLLDYTDTNKNTTSRSLSGVDNNGSGLVILYSGLWMNTAAVTSIQYVGYGANFSEYSTFALYGIKA